MASARTVSPTRAAQTVNSLRTVTSKLAAKVDAEVGRTGGLLRLAPCWVPRSFLQPGLRLKLHPDDVYTYGASRGGIDERWFASTTEAANEGRGDDEGLSYVVVGRERFTLRQAVAECGAGLIGQAIWGRYGRWPVYSKFFDNLGPIPHHLHQSQAQARLVGREGKPEGYYFPPQHNSVGNNFPYTFFGLEPGTSKADVRRCLERWNQGDNGILDLSKAYRLKPGTGWLVPPGVLHAPGSLCTYEPQWAATCSACIKAWSKAGSCRGTSWSKTCRPVSGAISTIWCGRSTGKRTSTRISRITTIWNPGSWPTPATPGSPTAGWFTGGLDGSSIFTAKELTVDPGTTCLVTDRGAYGLICVQGTGTINAQPLNSPKMIRFHELTEDEYFCTESGARAGVTFRNTSATEPLVCLRYFGPEVNPHAPAVGAKAPAAKPDAR